MSSNSYIIYDEKLSYDAGQGGLAIYLPTDNGYINYNFVHTVHEGKNANMWRLSVANLCDDEFQVIKQITKKGAEWEMAVRIQGREDFIGGYAHGDEKYLSLTVYVDGVRTDIVTINEFMEFDELKIEMESVGFDPNDGTTKALEHHKEYVITKEGITLHQRVEWLETFDMRANSYLAMMPPLKYSLTDSSDIITDTYYTNIDTIPREIGQSASVSLQDASSVSVFGKESGICFTMSKENYYPSCESSNLGILSDNGGLNYNKMYFVFAGEDTVKAGNIWTGTTIYKIECMKGVFSCKKQNM